jgi:hypothetical protein
MDMPSEVVHSLNHNLYRIEALAQAAEMDAADLNTVGFAQCLLEIIQEEIARALKTIEPFA